MATNTRNETTTSNATTKEFSYTFDVIKKEDVKVALDGVTQTSGYSVTTTPAKVTFDSAVGNGVKVRVYRDTEVDTPSDLRHTFQAGSAIRATDLNKMYEHALFGLQEEQEDGRILAEDINDDAVTRSKIIADAVDGTKIADDSIDSEHYVDASIDEAHLALSLIHI